LDVIEFEKIMNLLNLTSQPIKIAKATAKILKIAGQDFKFSLDTINQKNEVVKLILMIEYLFGGWISSHKSSQFLLGFVDTPFNITVS
jgi:hypothetical protein